MVNREKMIKVYLSGVITYNTSAMLTCYEKNHFEIKMQTINEDSYRLLQRHSSLVYLKVLIILSRHIFHSRPNETNPNQL